MFRASISLLALVLLPAVFAAAPVKLKPADVEKSYDAHAATAEEIALLKEAIKNTTQDVDRWAYTETTTTVKTRGRPKGQTIVRFDPSKPYPEQYTPELIEGKKPTDKQLEEYRKKGERRGERVARAAANAELPPGERTAPPPIRGAVPDLDHAEVVREDVAHITYRVAMHGDGHEKMPIDKFEFLMRVDKTRRVMSDISATLMEPVRVKLIAKVDSADMAVTFSTIDPKYPPLITSLTGVGEGSAFFMSVGVKTDRVRSNIERVKPYDERFEVKIGALKALDQ